MTKSREKLRIAFGTGAGLLLLVITGAATPSSSTASSTTTSAGLPSSSQLTHESVVVTAIDRAKRSATLQNADGETRSVTVPDDVKGFDTLKVGDKIEIDYFESVSLSMLPPGTKPAMTESAGGGRLADGKGVTGTRETQVSGTIVGVDAKANKVTFKGPRGNTRTVSVSDPAVQKKLPSLKIGQVVQLTYTEAIAASIRPAGALK